MAIILKPQDVLVVLKLVAIGQQSWSYAWLAVQLDMSPSQLHSAVQRAIAARLALRSEAGIVPQLRNLEEFLIHGVQYVFVPDRGELTRGIPTGYAAPPLRKHFPSTEEPPPVWPYPEGKTRGVSFSPLYKLAPRAATADAKLYELLVLVDAIRAGRAREREVAIQGLKKRFEQYA